MKLYDFTRAPNCRRVRIFAAEKGIALDLVEVDLGSRAQLGEDYLAKNPGATVPMLELDDGTRLTESIAICRYFEEIQPEPALFGTDPLGKATVEMWRRRVELEGLMAVADALRNGNPFFAGRALAGPQDLAQIPELATRAMVRLDRFFAMLDARLAESPYLAGEAFSVADIDALVTVDFARAVKRSIPDDAPALKRWHETVSARPSATH